MKDIKKLNKRLTFGIILLGTLTIILNIGRSYAFFQKTVSTNKPVIIIKTSKEPPVKYPTAVEVIKGTLGKTNGIRGVTTSNTIVTAESSNIREYRYSGTRVDNYIYFNCEDKVTLETASSKCDTWRVIGIFKETLADGSEEEYVKIVDNDFVAGTWFPDTYEVEGTTYKIKSTDTSYPNAAYWNYINGDNTDKNDWSKAGLQYWLNAGEDKQTKKPADGYLSYLGSEAKSMIRETTYPLGIVKGDTDTPKTAYAHERSTSTTCSSDCNGGDIISGNAATWTGKVALMYPSDYGFSKSSSYWDEVLFDLALSYSSSAKTSWMYTSMTDARYSNSWLLSPGASSYVASSWLLYGKTNSHSVYWYDNVVHVALSLLSNAQIVAGKGTSDEPWLVKPE